MIVYNLSCSGQHSFEGWFASGDEYERQAGAGLIACPVCGDHHITRMPSGPHVRKAISEPAVAEVEAEVEKLLEGLVRIVEGSEDVGEDFADEARRIHFMEAPVRNIRGVATLRDAQELLEEGLPVLAFPMPVKKGLH